MFEQLTDRLTGTFDRLRGKPRVTESDLDEALREIRIALLEADVQYGVVKDLVARVRERAKGQDVLQTISGPQQVVKIVHDELVATLGATETALQFAAQPPTVILLVGLQGSGKTTTAAKVASLVRKRGRRPMLVAADPYRPAAVEQLVTLGKQIDLPVRTADGMAPPELVQRAAADASRDGRDVIIADTAGRLHVDDEMMRELERMVALTHPTEVLLVADAMTGQDAVRAASEFRARLPLTGLILTKVDGDARGGAALSIRAATGVPIKFLGTGEKLDALEPFHPDRLAGRILGMGDVLTLVEKAQEHVDRAQAEEQARKFLEARFTLDDFLAQLKQVRKLGPLSQLLAMVPGMQQMAKQVPEAEAERELTKIEAIISSMTRAERVDPSIISGSRRRRIARGSGTTVQDVNQLLKQFVEMQKLMRQMGTMAKGGRVPRFPGLVR
ncbi:MAG TPA: signal recognition particle protein [Candidatus Dormibacteraeota bacterium]|nr:signal recognition particle protein [Candidatus Dormibacteraeota bacterium]